MNFEDKLLNGIPHAEAAAYFLRIRGKDKVAAVTPAALEAALQELPENERRALIKSAGLHLGAAAPGAVKKAAPMGAPTPTPAAALPATGRGQNMQPQPPPALPPTGMGMQSMPGMKVAADKEKKSPEETGKERAHASLSAEFEKEKAHKSERHGDILGRLGGAVAGGAAAHRYGAGNPLATLGGVALGQHMGGKLGREAGAGVDRHRHEKAASAFKLALEQMGMQPQQVQGIEPELDPATQEMLALEQAAGEATDQNEAAFLRTRLQQVQAEAEQAKAEAATLGEQQAMHEQQLQTIQQQVADSTSKAMAATDQVLQQQQAAAAFRMAYQQLRGQMLEAASAEPPSLTPTPGADAAAAAASQGAGASSAPAPTAGPAGNAPSPGTAPGSPGPTGDATVNAPSAGNEPLFGNATATTKTEQQEPTGDAKTPQKEVLSHYRPFVGEAKLAALRDFFAGQLGDVAKRLPHAAAGAAIGAGIGAGESFTSNAPLQKKVQELEGKPDRGYGDTLNLAQARARLTVGDFAKKHPAAMMGMGALGGGLAGATEGPEFVDTVRRSGEHLHGIGKNLKTIFSKAQGAG